MEQKIVVHTKQGKIHKGVTHDFEPSGESFHCLPAEGGGVPVRLKIDDLKALFWVRDYLGNRHFVSRKSFTDEDPEQRAIVTFQDGEQIYGTMQENGEHELGFFLFPIDSEDNNIRIFVIRSALKELQRVT